MLIRLLLVALLLAIGYVVYNPAIIPNPEIQQKVLGMRDEMMQPNSQVSQMAGNMWAGVTKVFLDFAKNTKLPKSITGLPEEVVVEGAVKQLTEQVKQLPAKEAHKVKQSFCQDIVEEAQKQN